MDIRKVKKLIELLEESNVQEIEIKEGEESVRISRGGNSVQMVAAQGPGARKNWKSASTRAGRVNDGTAMLVVIKKSPH